jgi:carbonic anhydrase/acetyltransferase-like protein (isoleucine patch superfamily)
VRKWIGERMTLYQFEGLKPVVGNNSYVARSAEVVGDVKIGENCYIGPGAKIRGDYGSIRIGNNTSVQENCVLHAGPDQNAVIGDNVSIGHGAIVHGPLIHNFVIVGMGAIVADHAEINDWCIIAAGALVTSNTVIERESLVVGVPAKTIRKITDENRNLITFTAGLYSNLAPRYLEGLQEIK